MNTPTPPQRKAVSQVPSDTGNMGQSPTGAGAAGAYNANRRPATAMPAESEHRESSGLTADNFPVGHEDTSPQADA